MIVYQMLGTSGEIADRLHKPFDILKREGKTPDLSMYACVFRGCVEAETLYEAVQQFNSGDYFPKNFLGRPYMSVSDIICVDESKIVKPRYYYVDMFGFREVQ